MELREIDLKVLEFIRTYYRDQHMTPSHDEISAATGVSRGGTSNKVFKNLAEAGAIIYADDGRRYLPADWREIVNEDTADELRRLRALVKKYEADHEVLKTRKQQAVKRQLAYKKRKRLAEKEVKKV